MQDGRCMLKPRATRTLLRVDGNERDVTRTRGMSSGPEKEREREREREREIKNKRRKKKRRKTNKEERGSNTRINEKKGDENGKREMNNAWGRRRNT